MKKLDLPDVTVNSARAYHFLMVPKGLFLDPAFEDLSHTAVLLYSLFRERASLSAGKPDQFTDEEGRLFILFTVEEIMATLRVAKATAVGTVKQLEEIGLIERKRRGQGKPALIYVKDIATVDYTYEDPDPSLGYDPKVEDSNYYQKFYETPESSDCRLQEVQSENLKKSRDFCGSKSEPRQGLKFKPRKVQKLNPNKKNNKEDSKKKDLPSLLTSLPDEGRTDGSSCWIHRGQGDCRGEIQEQIMFERLADEYGEQEAQEVVCLIEDVMQAKGGSISVNGAKMPIDIVQGRFFQLEYEDVASVLDRLKYAADVRNPHAYIRSMLFNSRACNTLAVRAQYDRDWAN